MRRRRSGKVVLVAGLVGVALAGGALPSGAGTMNMFQMWGEVVDSSGVPVAVPGGVVEAWLVSAQLAAMDAECVDGELPTGFDFVKIDDSAYKRAQGDSGGPVFMNGSTPVGIHAGGSGSVSIYSKITYLPTGVTLKKG